MKQPITYNHASSMPLHWGRVEQARMRLSSAQKHLSAAIRRDADDDEIGRLERQIEAAWLVLDNQTKVAKLTEAGRHDLVARLAA